MRLGTARRRRVANAHTAAPAVATTRRSTIPNEEEDPREVCAPEGDEEEGEECKRKKK